jgi:predicted RNase H-like HicB family nuclease
MLYPVYVHVGDEKHAHGVTIPDFPGCFSAADSWEYLPAKIQQAIELYCEGEDMDIPHPTPLEKLATDSAYEGGVWMLIDIDVSKLSGKSKRVNITLPERVLAVLDAAAKKEGETRSGLLVKAALEYVERHRAA